MISDLDLTDDICIMEDNTPKAQERLNLVTDSATEIGSEINQKTTKVMTACCWFVAIKCTAPIATV